MWFDYGVILCGAFLGAVTTGSAGFAFALVGTAVWLHVLPPAEAVPLAVLCSLLLNLALIWKLRDGVVLARLWPFVAGGLIGVPLGVAVLASVDEAWLRLSVGSILIGYSLWRLTRAAPPMLALAPGTGRLFDGMVGMIGGALGGATSLSGVLPTLWCGLRGWSSREQRGVFQPYILVMHLVTLAWFVAAGVVSRKTLLHFGVTLPALALGGLLGLRIYAFVSEAGFQRMVLALFLVSGGALLWRG